MTQGRNLRLSRAAATAAALLLLTGCIPGLPIGSGATTVCVLCSTSIGGSSSAQATTAPAEPVGAVPGAHARAGAPSATTAPDSPPPPSEAGTAPSEADTASSGATTPPAGPTPLLDGVPGLGLLPDLPDPMGLLPGGEAETETEAKPEPGAAAPPPPDKGKPEPEAAAVENRAASLEAALAASLRGHEGLELTPYLDQSGRVHIGYGHQITVATAERLMSEDMADALAEARRVAGDVTWEGLSTARRAVLAEMAYTLGEGGLGDFEKFLAALDTGHYDTAADEMLDSEWAAQAPARVARLAAVMRRG